MTLSGLLRKRIEGFHRSLRKDNPLYRAAVSDTISEEVLRRYQANCRYLVRRTPHLLQAAAASAARLDMPELQAYYEQCLQRFQSGRHHPSHPSGRGHRISDDQLQPLPGMSGLVDYALAIIEKDPRLYLPCYWLAESFGVSDQGGDQPPLTGEPFLREEWAGIIGRFLDDPGQATSCLVALENCMDWYSRFCWELVGHHGAA